MKLHSPLPFPVLCACLLSLLLGQELKAQEPTPPPSAAEITSRVQGLTARTDLDEALRKRAADAYTNALSALNHTADFSARAAQAVQRTQSAPRDLEEVKARLAALEKPSPEVEVGGSLSDAESAATAARRTLTQARERLDNLRREIEQRRERRRVSVERQGQVRQEQSALRSSASAPRPTTEPALAEHVLARAQFALTTAEAEALERELVADDARTDLVASQSDLATRQIAHAEEIVKVWDAVVTRRRRTEATAQAKQARALEEAARTSPRLSAVAEESRRLAERRLGKEGLTARREATEHSLKSRRSGLRQLRASFARLRRRVEAGVPNQTLGVLLRRQLEELPSAHELADEREALADPLAKLQSDLVELEEIREGAGDIEGLIAEMLPPPGEGRQAFNLVAREVLEARRDLLGALITEQQSHLEDLLELDQVLHSLRLAEAELRAYAEERILWIPSVQGSLIPQATEVSAGFSWLADFRGVAASLRSQPRPPLWSLVLLFFLAIGLLLSIVWRRRGPGPTAGKALDAGAWRESLRRITPLLLLCAIALLIGTSLAGSDHLRALGATLRTTSLYLAVLTVLWGISPYVGGVPLRRLLLLCAPPFLLASALVAAMEHAPELSWTNALGRMSFVLAMLIEAGALGWALREEGPLGAVLRKQEGLLGRLAPIIPYLAVGLPLATAALALSGYYYTGLRLEVRFEGTLLAAMVAAFSYEVLLAAMAAPAKSALPVSAQVLYDAAALSASNLDLTASASIAAASAESARLTAAEEQSEDQQDEGQKSPDQKGQDQKSQGQKSQETPLPRAEESPRTSPASSADAPKATPALSEPTSLIGDPVGEVLDASPAETVGEIAAGLTAEQAQEVALALGLREDPQRSAPAPSESEAEGGGPEDPAPAPEEAAASAEEVSQHLVGLASQARDTVRVLVALGLLLALAALWADVLPALRRLRDLRLYPHVEVVDLSRSERYPALEDLAPSAKDSPPARSTGSAPAASTPKLSPLSPPSTDSTAASEPLIVTAADLGLALLLILVTFALVRSLPGALEFALIGRLPLDAGARYAASTIARYAVAFVGIGASAQAIGIGWSRIQWLAAALTFGLAFGLQEIFANFISGLIILFERPVRVGDIVTLGDVTGKVSRVRMRATTITDWNRKELIIPNKELVTGRVINWTLTESVTRTVIPIGIAYGSDVERARTLILSAASAQPDVMSEPEPSCWFTAFGDSVYQLELRVWLPRPDCIPETRHEILERVRHSFDRAKIEIAFPQRDIHIRSMEPIRLADEKKRR